MLPPNGRAVVRAASGRIVNWGSNLSGQCNEPVGVIVTTLVAACGNHTVAMMPPDGPCPIGKNGIDSDADGLEDGCQRARGDLNLDRRIDAADLGLMLASWGLPDPIGDLDGDGEAGASDLSLLLANWGQY